VEPRPEGRQCGDGSTLDSAGEQYPGCLDDGLHDVGFAGFQIMQARQVAPFGRGDLLARPGGVV